MSDSTAPMTPAGRKRMIERVCVGTAQTQVAEQLCVSRATATGGLVRCSERRVRRARNQTRVPQLLITTPTHDGG